jgi:hypothetical protein
MTLNVIPYGRVPLERMILGKSINLQGACGTEGGVVTLWLS